MSSPATNNVTAPVFSVHSEEFVHTHRYALDISVQLIQQFATLKDNKAIDYIKKKNIYKAEIRNLIK